MYIHDIAAPDLLGDRLLAEVKDVRDLVRQGDGSLVWVGSDGVGHVLDPETGRETAAFALGSDVRDIAYDAPWLLVHDPRPASCGGPAEAAADRSPGGSWPPAGEVRPVR